MSGRPQPTEAAPYYFTYIDQVPGENVLAVIESQLDECLQLLSTISEDKSLHRYGVEKWSIRQVLNHLSDTERAFAFRALWFARGFDAPLPSYDQNIAAANAEADAIRWDSHVDEFKRVRLATISLSGIFLLRPGCAPASPAVIRSPSARWLSLLRAT